MDYLLKRENLEFSIDQIAPLDSSADSFVVTIIPKINYKTEIPFFAPLHLRNINASADLLQEQFFNAVIKNMGQWYNFDSQKEMKGFKGSVVQGAYYKVPTDRIPLTVFSAKTIIDSNSDFFEKNIADYENLFIYKTEQKSIMSMKIGTERISDSSEDLFDALYIYGLNVGQGDSILLICPNGSVYLIDTNFYWDNKNSVKRFPQIKDILKSHGLPEEKIKALIITHKHIDHLRGAAALLKEFEVEFFLINHDYDHPTQPVHSLLETASKCIPNWINVNGPGVIHEGQAEIIISNPDKHTNNNSGAPDINDSSIALCVRYLNHSAFLTGDAGSSVLNGAFNGSGRSLDPKHNFLKVSHHGSVTGTNRQVLSTLNPGKCFISAGQNQRYNHPDSGVVSRINHHCGRHNLIISKKVQKTVCYIPDRSGLWLCKTIK